MENVEFSEIMKKIRRIGTYINYPYFQKTAEVAILVKYIIDIHPSYLNRREDDVFGYTLIIALIKYYTIYSIPLITCLINKGADINLADEFSDYSPLHHAARDNKLEVVKLLIEKGADPRRISSRFKGTPYNIANSSGNHEIADYLSGYR